MSKKSEATLASFTKDVPPGEPTTPEPLPDAAQAPDRPDWLLSNFTNVEDQAKAYVELRKTFGAQKGAPEEYEWGELAEEFDLDNQHIKEFQVWAKENRLSQDAFHKTAKTYADYMTSLRPDPNKELERLGANGAQTLNAVQNWVKNVGGEKGYKALEKMAVTAENIEFLDELRQRYVHGMSRVPTETSQPDFKRMTVAEVESEMQQNFARYNADSAYRAQISAKFAQAVGE